MDAGSGPVWPDGARLALSLLVVLADPPAGGADPARSDYGWRAGWPRLLTMLRDRGLPVTVAAHPRSLARRSEIASAVRAAGYDLCAVGSAGLDGTAVAAAVAELERVAGIRPLGWLSQPAQPPAPRSALAAAGLLYDCDAADDDRPYWVDAAGRPHLVIPQGPAGALGPAFDQLHREGGRMLAPTLHPGLAGQPAEAAALAEALDHILAQDGVWACRRGDLARHWAARHPPG